MFYITEPRSYKIFNDYYKNFKVKAGSLFKHNSGNGCGIKFIRKASRILAKMIEKQDYTKYTSHSFRRSSATMLVTNGATDSILSNAGRWKSQSVMKGYIQDNPEMKRKISNLIIPSAAEKIEIKKVKMEQENGKDVGSGSRIVTISNCTNLTLNI